jgi:hypothetical protein
MSKMKGNMFVTIGGKKIEQLNDKEIEDLNENFLK